MVVWRNNMTEFLQEIRVPYEYKGIKKPSVEELIKAGPAFIHEIKTPLYDDWENMNKVLDETNKTITIL